MGSSSIKKKNQSSNNFSFLPPTLRSQIKIFPNILAKVLKKKKKHIAAKVYSSYLPLELLLYDLVRLLWKKHFLLHFGKGVSLLPSDEML